MGAPDNSGNIFINKESGGLCFLICCKIQIYHQFKIYKVIISELL
jgi:hypothetical protein